MRRSNSFRPTDQRLLDYVTGAFKTPLSPLRFYWSAQQRTFPSLPLHKFWSLVSIWLEELINLLVLVLIQVFQTKRISSVRMCVCVWAGVGGRGERDFKELAQEVLRAD